VLASATNRNSAWANVKCDLSAFRHSAFFCGVGSPPSATGGYTLAGPCADGVKCVSTYIPGHVYTNTAFVPLNDCDAATMASRSALTLFKVWVEENEWREWVEESEWKRVREGREWKRVSEERVWVKIVSEECEWKRVSGRVWVEENEWREWVEESNWTRVIQESNWKRVSDKRDDRVDENEWMRCCHDVVEVGTHCLDVERRVVSIDALEHRSVLVHHPVGKVEHAEVVVTRVARVGVGRTITLWREWVEEIKRVRQMR
jgi:hypothetical protein